MSHFASCTRLENKMKTFVAVLVFLAIAVSPSFSIDVDGCGGLDNGEYPYDDNCRKFVSCFDEKGTVELCPNDWLFSSGRGYCDEQEFVDCGDRPLCNEDDEDCEEHHVETVPPPVQCEDVECEGGEDEYISLGPCEQDFCHCSGGIPLLDTCADGLFYNPAIGACDWPYNNPGCDGVDY